MGSEYDTMCSVLHLSKEVSQLHPVYGHSIRVLHWAVDQTMSNTLADMELTASQGHILAFIAHAPQPPCPRDMEEAFQLSHPTISGILSRLKKKGFICITPDGTDRRCKRVSLDEKGRACLARMEETITDNERRMVEHFTEEEKQLFADFLNRAILNMGGASCRLQHKEESD